VHILLTKADKLKSGAGKNALLQVQKELAEMSPDGLTDDLTTVQLFSSPKGTGLDEVYRVLDHWLDVPEK